MELRIKKDQSDKKGLFGGHKGVNFSLKYRVFLTQEEWDLIKRYKVENEVLAKSETDTPITMNDLLTGQSQVTSNIEVLLHKEKLAIAICKKFKTYLDVLKSFGGEYKLDFQSEGIYDEAGNLIEEY